MNDGEPAIRTGAYKAWWRRHVATIASRAAVLVTLASGACATAPPRSVAPLLGEARQNEVAAYAKNRDQSLRVAGVVLQTGLDVYSRVVVDGYGYGGWAMSLSARDQLEHYPYALVGDDRNPSPDMLKCLFSTEDADLVGKLLPGMKVVLNGRFFQYVHDQGRVILVLSSCSID